MIRDLLSVICLLLVQLWDGEVSLRLMIKNDSPSSGISLEGIWVLLKLEDILRSTGVEVAWDNVDIDLANEIGLENVLRSGVSFESFNLSALCLMGVILLIQFLLFAGVLGDAMLSLHIGLNIGVLGNSKLGAVKENGEFPKLILSSKS